MTSISKFTLGLAILLGGTSAVAVAAQQQAAQAAAPAKEYKLSKEERAGIGPLQEAVNAKNTAAATAALPAAQVSAKGADAQYILGQLMLKLGLDSQNVALQRQAIDVLLATATTPEKDIAILQLNKAALAANAGDAKAAEEAMTRAAQLAPNDPQVIISLAEAKVAAKKPGEAVDLITKAIDLKKAAGQPVLESWYKRALSLALQNKMAPQSIALSKSLVAAYPNQTNWRDALLIYRDNTQLDEATQLDVMRLMRAAKALNGERDYYRFAHELRSGGFPAESKAVLDEGIAAKFVDASKSPFKELIAANAGQIRGDRDGLAAAETKAKAAADSKLATTTADAYFGYGEYAKAAELYRVALQKGGDANMLNTRLGAALALGGQKAEAEAALKTVQGSRADLAVFWMAWLANRG
ncbi:hypothetical protein [Allosphingosinicella vermicomposti]|uniref:hypothetical protein n=1 Tax=Allosphingosinicella vermicomposti TaxID=614671 RepID=UPI000D0FD5DE|nr:hypothetical protein [Allosphingosinicella vermicomposti]